jgi:aldehyde:ferredoxin oxidoreductase
MSYRGKVLRVNLSSGDVAKEPLNMSWAEKYFGGPGLADKYLYEELESGIDLLSPANKFIIATGPLTGTNAPCSGRVSITTKSPLNGAILNSYMGGDLAPQLKWAGYDMLIIEGKSEKPAYLLINDDKVEIKDATWLWGKGTYETEDKLHEEYGKGVSVTTIGPAGEKLLTVAIVDSGHRQAARGAPGAVLGSKNLKAIVCSGSKSVGVADMPRFLEAVKKTMKEDLPSKANGWVREGGTPLIVDLTDAVGILPTRNWQDGSFEGSKKINGDRVRERNPQKKACFACPQCCGHYNVLNDVAVEGPEYETLALCGASCGIADLEAVIRFNALCDDFGIDTISTGNIVGFAMEMTEKGIKDFGVRFGDIDNYLKMPELIAYQKGVGKDLSRGVKYLGEKYGGKEFAMQVKGLELPGYDPRGSWSMGLAYATALRGGCHQPAWPAGEEALGDLNPFTIEGKAKIVIRLQNDNAIKWSLPICDFLSLRQETMSELISAAIGREVCVEELKKAGDRIWNVGKLFNLREGFSIADDSLPDRILTEPLKSKRPAGKIFPREEFDVMLQEYYKLRGWDTNGVPTPEKLNELEI